jgi:hypothetical protein
MTLMRSFGGRRKGGAFFDENEKNAGFAHGQKQVPSHWQKTFQ